MKPHHLLQLLLIALVASFSIDAGDFWTQIQQMDVFQQLTLCERNCITSVNGSLTNGEITCVSYGCVCATSNLDPNYVNAKANIGACAAKNCGSSDNAVTAFEQICLFYGSAITRDPLPPGQNVTLITSPGYANLTACGKFALNSCRDENGTQNEKNCAPDIKWKGWEQFRGLADARNCTTPQCLCEDPKYDATVGELNTILEEYCGISFSTPTVPNPASDSVQNVLANFCASWGFPHLNFTTEVVGVVPQGANNATSSNGSSNTTGGTNNSGTNNSQKWSTGAIITTVLGFMMLLLSSWQTYRAELNRRDAIRNSRDS